MSRGHAHPECINDGRRWWRYGGRPPAQLITAEACAALGVSRASVYRQRASLAQPPVPPRPRPASHRALCCPVSRGDGAFFLSLVAVSCLCECARKEAGRVDVGDQALMRGLATAFPSVRPRHSLSYCGHRYRTGHKAPDGSSSAVAPPPPLRADVRALYPKQRFVGWPTEPPCARG